MGLPDTTTTTMGTSRQLVLGLLFGLVLVWTVRSVNLYLARRRFKQQHGCQPVRSWFYNRDPILGLDAIYNMLQRSKAGTVLEWIHWRNRTYGPTFGTRMGMHLPSWMGGSASGYAFSTTDPENIKAVLATRFKDYGHGNTRTGTFGPLLGSGIFVVDGARWHESRALLRPNFAREQVADLESLERHFSLLLSLIPQSGDATVNLATLFFRLTIDTSSEFLFGTSVDSLRALKESGGDPNKTSADSAFAKAMNDAQVDILTRTRFRWLYHLTSHPHAKEAIEFIHAYVDRFVDEAVRQREALDLEKGSSTATTTTDGEKYVFLRELAKVTKDRKVIRDELLNILLAGRDTTASLLSNFFFVLAKRPDVWAKLKAEVAGLEGRAPTYETLKGLKYVKYCLNECEPTSPLHPFYKWPQMIRKYVLVAITDTWLHIHSPPHPPRRPPEQPRGHAGHGPAPRRGSRRAVPVFVPKGTVVGWSCYVLHRNRAYYGDDADEFRPERWETLRPSWEYLPFNGGPRIFVGQQYALTEAAYVTIRLVQEFERIESRDPGPWVESIGLTVCPRNGTKVGMYRSTSS
ncbi:cytochrome P450 52A12 [Apiospora saccharicola]|uniref:Cytochrome P450 52A12 n=1 Tax=Apiospora saccharicola TaxID=335842 RepID=A0ABR1W476_9PEZI